MKVSIPYRQPTNGVPLKLEGTVVFVSIPYRQPTNLVVTHPGYYVTVFQFLIGSLQTGEISDISWWGDEGFNSLQVAYKRM